MIFVEKLTNENSNLLNILREKLMVVLEETPDTWTGEMINFMILKQKMKKLRKRLRILRLIYAKKSKMIIMIVCLEDQKLNLISCILFFKAQIVIYILHTQQK